MSSLSKGNLNEIASLYSGITLNESVEEKQESADLSEEVLSEEAIQENSTFIFQVIGNHLIEKKLADSPESAVKIMENMSDGWAEDILADYVASTDPELVEGSNPFDPRAALKSGLKRGFDYAKGRNRDISRETRRPGREPCSFLRQSGAEEELGEYHHQMRGGLNCPRPR